MLRASLLRARPALRPIAPIVRPQWRVAQRCFADEKKPSDIVLPNTAPLTSPPKTNTVQTRTIPASEVPLVPHEPETTTPTTSPTAAPKTTASRAAPVEQPATTPPTGPGAASVAPSPQQAPKPKKRRFRRFLFYMALLSALGYAGGVWYSLVSDNFHDFFTEYVPFAEDAVGYFEEREFRRRFPGRAGTPRLHPQVTGENKVTIPSKSGLGPRVTQEGPHVSAVSDNQPHATPKESGAPKVGSNTPPPQKSHQENKKESEQKVAPAESSSHALLPKDAVKADPNKETAKPAPAPVPAPAITPVDHLNVPAASEPVVQDVVKIVNDIITVINSDTAHGNKYNSALEKAKGDLGKVISDITLLKDTLSQDAEKKIKSAHSEFDEAAKELIRRMEAQMHDQETHWKEEYENERERLSQTYKQRMQAELDAAKQAHEQKLNNELLEQSIALQRQFSSTVRDRVETERDGRLGKLNELSSSVQELENLTAEWNSVVEANLKTQHLVVAVEAVKSALENQVVPKPFVSELAALKEIAEEDSVVSAAIASINPVAYQRGIPNSGQLIDRFRRVAQEVRKAALLPEDAGVASHLASLAMSKVLFKKSGLAVGGDVEAVLARTEVLLEEGDLDGAAREMNGLHGWAKVLSKDWLGECRRVLEVRQALDVIATEARLQSLLVD
jgi:mitofilin